MIGWAVHDMHAASYYMQYIAVVCCSSSWKAVAVWRWNTGDDEHCGICRNLFDGTCPRCKEPGDNCPLMWGGCKHCFHMHCIMKWLSSQQGAQQCPMCRQPWTHLE
eukprot:scpid35886/ scgid32039/ Anaphase-promoting complex subunit 11; Cyclosome subunit 11